ncbi:MAG: deoxyribonuclease IV [candidate division Zixibacteria bacterium]|nr:deoxyribonuclease IV [candidate division Zixibacteria bacterium]
MSIAGGAFNAFKQGETFGCDTIQIFVKSANQWKAKPLSDEEIEKFRAEQERTGITPVIAHASYLINLGSPDKTMLEKSRQAFLIEMERCAKLRIPSLVVHPGSHMKAGEETGINNIAESISWLLEHSNGFNVNIALETTAGQGTNLGYRFEQLAAMIDKANNPDGLVVCLDTCHVFAAGYNIASKGGYEQTWDDFDRIIGLNKLAVIHLNDSKTELGSRVDRHEHIGQGKLGQKAFGFIMKDKRLVKIPKILETPKGDNGLMDEINLGILRKLA